MEKLEFKGTKGSWELRGCRIFVKDTFLSIAEVHVQSNYEAVTFKPKKDVEAEANAKLIASAPDLLEALQEVRKHMNAYIPEKVFDLVDQAIEKALKQALVSQPLRVESATIPRGLFSNN